MTIIGISGKIGHGKDVIASYLVGHHGFQIIRMSDEIKEEILARLPRTLAAIASFTHPALNTPEGLRKLVYDIKPYGVRELLQEYGTEVRRADSFDYWVQKWEARIRHWKGSRVVVPDIRYENEVLAIWNMGGAVWRVERPGAPSNDHVSETSLDHFTRWNARIENNGTVEELEYKALTALLMCLSGGV